MQAPFGFAYRFVQNLQISKLGFPAFPLAGVFSCDLMPLCFYLLYLLGWMCRGFVVTLFS